MNTKMYLIAFVLLVVALIIKRIGNDPSVIGKTGEHKVSKILSSLPREYRILNNVICIILNKWHHYCQKGNKH